MQYLRAVLLLMIPVSVLIADTIHVPGDYPTIQQAIDAAAGGDTVLVSAGTYAENIDFKGKAIIVTGSGEPSVTVIDGGQAGSVVSFMTGEGPDSVLQGFTLFNGNGTMNGGNTYGGGIYCKNASPTIASNIIRNNTVGWLGGGIWTGTFGGSPTIDGNLICFNYAAYGGGISSSGSAIITNNTISNNDAAWNGGGATGNGGGIFCDCSPIIAGNTIEENRAWDFGGGICCGISSTISGNTIRNNEAGDSGGGIDCFGSLTPTLHNNVITGNKAGAIWYGDHGAISCGSFSAKIINNTITFNSAVVGNGGIGFKHGSNPTVTNTILWGNAGTQISGGNPAVTYSCVQGGFTGTGNIDADPLFVDPAGSDFHITYGSPCRCSGDNAAVLADHDVEGDPRIAYGTVDMGADEFYTHLYITGDKTPGGAIQGKFVGLPGTTPLGLFVGAQALPSAIQTMWGDFWIDLTAPWVLFYPLGQIPANGVTVLNKRLLGTPPAPYDVPMQALIGLNSDSLTNLCVLEVR